MRLGATHYSRRVAGRPCLGSRHGGDVVQEHQAFDVMCDHLGIDSLAKLEWSPDGGRGLASLEPVSSSPLLTVPLDVCIIVRSRSNGRGGGLPRAPSLPADVASRLEQGEGLRGDTAALQPCGRRMPCRGLSNACARALPVSGTPPPAPLSQ